MTARPIAGCGMSRILCQVSCGAPSAVAAKITLAQHPDAIILNAFLAKEHPDNRRFLADCERWFGRQAVVLRDTKYDADPVVVFHKRGFIKSRRGASCSTSLKRGLLAAFEQPGDVLVLGYSLEEIDRLDDFREHFPDRPVLAPLIDAGLTKADCKAMVERAGIQLPMMYRLGYDNANCIGCVKGGEGYWRAIREDFPEEFEQVAAAEEAIGETAFLFRDRDTGKRWSLRELGDGPVRRNEKLPSCSFFCEIAEQGYAA